jgi:hypothetical protein
MDANSRDATEGMVPPRNHRRLPQPTDAPSIRTPVPKEVGGRRESRGGKAMAARWPETEAATTKASTTPATPTPVDHGDDQGRQGAKA